MVNILRARWIEFRFKSDAMFAHSVHAWLVKRNAIRHHSFFPVVKVVFPDIWRRVCGATSSAVADVNKFIRYVMRESGR